MGNTILSFSDSKLEKYKILKQLEQGDFGVILKCLDTETNKTAPAPSLSLLLLLLVHTKFCHLHLMALFPYLGKIEESLNTVIICPTLNVFL